MNIETLVLIALMVGAWYWFSKRAKRDLPPTTRQEEQRPTSSADQIGTSDSSDAFLAKVVAAKNRSESEVKSVSQQYSRELEARFAQDVKLKERLAKFAKANELDKALIALLEEIQHYPASSLRVDFAKWKKLDIQDISGSKEKDTELVEFSYGEQRFKLSEKKSSG